MFYDIANKKDAKKAEELLKTNGISYTRHPDYKELYIYNQLNFNKDNLEKRYAQEFLKSGKITREENKMYLFAMERAARSLLSALTSKSQDEELFHLADKSIREHFERAFSLYCEKDNLKEF